MAQRRFAFLILAEGALRIAKSLGKKNQLAEAAINGLMDKGYPVEPGMCCAWVREVVQQNLGHQFDRYWWKGDANGSAEAFRRSPYAVEGEPQVGDIHFQTGPQHGPHGHVGIRVYGNYMAQNSSRWGAKIPDGRGLTGLWTREEGDVVVRLK